MNRCKLGWAVAGLTIALLVLTTTSANAALTGELGILDEAWFAANPTNPGTSAPWQDGDTYHLAFVTSTTTNATSTDIGYYDAFVQAAADAAGIGATTGVTWYAIASTATVDAKDNAVVSAPVYNMSTNMLPELVAINASDMWNGDITSPILYTENREIPDYSVYPPARFVWTGSGPSGVADRPLGSAKPMVGGSDEANGEWIACYWAACLQREGFRVYGLSAALEVISEDTTIPGDANGSGFVDDTDLAILLGNWESDALIISTWTLGNFTEVSLGDTDVNDSDLAVLLGNWTGPPPPGGAAVPEPATLALLGLGGLSVLRRRRSCLRP